MAIILSISAWGQSSESFRKQISEALEMDVKSIDWHLTKGPQKIVDILDTRSGKEVIVQLASSIIEVLEDAEKDKSDVYLISNLNGSRITEEALSMVKGISKLNIKVIHILLGPSIEGTEWTSIGKYAMSAVALGLTGLLMSKTSGKTRLTAAVLGLAGSFASFHRETVADSLEINEESKIGYAKIKRHIFHSANDTNIPLDIPNANYYVGDYTQEEIADLKDEQLIQAFNYRRRFQDQRHSKIKILKQVIGL